MVRRIQPAGHLDWMYLEILRLLAKMRVADSDFEKEMNP